ncbi:hypothetical protein ACIHFD_34180 [Nonomuraea sp. NPDC051941]|uniref:hypothetical protein n=1 Tax=Nonomuraea sp. NPDC051941 TaxID=3364373 RepID=UPI0037C7070E
MHERAERMRFAGNLHDIRGHTLHVVKPTAPARKPVRADAERAEEELREIRVRVDRKAEVAPHAGELPGPVLRETTTDILRHVQTEQVRITLPQPGIAVIDDGPQEAPLPALRGLATLRERVMANGDELTVEQKDGRFLTIAAFPHRRSEAQENR